MFRRYLLPLLKVFGFITLYTVAMTIMIGLVYFTSGKEPPEQLLGLLSLVTAVLVTLLYLRHDRVSFGDIGCSFGRGWHLELAKGGVEGAVAVLLVFGLIFLAGMAEIRGLDRSTAEQIIRTLMEGFLVYLISVAFTEELMNRGYIYHYLKRRLTVTGAVLTTSMAFALMHIFNPGITPLALFNIFLAGAVLNLLVLRDGRLWSAVGFHFSWNFIMGTVFASPVSGGGQEGIIRLSLVGDELFNGGAFGIEGGLICTSILLLFCAYLLYSNQHRNDFFAGLKLWKNKLLVGILIIGTLIYISYDVIMWIPKQALTDGMEANRSLYSQDVHDYNMKLVLDTNGKLLSGQQTVSFINNEDVPLSEAYFHIYPNAFKELGGSIAIKGVKINGGDSQYRIEGQDSTLLYIPFLSPLQPGSRYQIFIEYEVSIPKDGGNGFGDRFGYGANTFNLGNFFPIAAVYENGGWDKHPYDDKGDAFYSETGNYDVEIITPEKQVVACSGYIEEQKVEAGIRKYKIKAYSVRDFAFVSSDMFKVEEVMVDGTLVRSYASSSRKAKKVLEYGREAIRLFNRSYGQYPYPTCSIVQSDIGGGMEYPNLVMIEANEYGNVSLDNYVAAYYYGKPKGSLEFVVVHELAHQWWYGMVGNDEYREAWIDEPLTQYSTLEYFRQRYGQKEFDRLYERYIKLGIKDFMGFESGGDKSLDRSLDQFSENEYYILIYNKGAMMFKDLEDQMGDEKFDKMLRALFDRYKFGVVTGKQLIQLTSEIAGEDMGDFFQGWLETDFTGDELY